LSKIEEVFLSACGNLFVLTSGPLEAKI
jgi:hypothetical protein